MKVNVLFSDTSLTLVFERKVRETTVSKADFVRTSIVNSHIYHVEISFV